MKFIKNIILLSIALFFLSVKCFAAVDKPVEWKVSIVKVSDREGIVRASATIADGWHVYGNALPESPEMPPATLLTIEPSDEYKVIAADKPSECSQIPLVHKDESLGLELPWLTGSFTLSRRFRLEEGVDGVEVKGEITYMPCTETACTPPARYEFSIPFGNIISPNDENPTSTLQEPSASEVGHIPAKEMSEVERWWAPVEVGNDHSSAESDWLVFFFGFLGGLLALLTPCVWPMIPMTMSFFLKGKKNDRKSAVVDAALYALSIVVIFVSLGIIMTLIFGPGKLNEIATGAVFNLVFFAILVVFGLSFLGAFEIRLPASWGNAIDSKAEKTGGFLGIFLMAGTLVVVSFSCTGPIIGTLLVEAFSEGRILGPFMGMSGFALGLALPFGLFAMFPSMVKEMPKSGSWLNTVKVTLGFIELILSLKFLSVADLAYGWRILDREIFLAIWIVLFLLMGMYLLGKLYFRHDDIPEGGSKIGVVRFMLAVMSLSFAAYLLPGLWGAPLKGISAFAPPLYTQDFNLYGGEFKEYDNYEEGMKVAKERGLPVLVDFSGFGCVNCRKMEGAVFDSPAVRTIIEDNFILIKLMVDDKTPLSEPTKVDEGGETLTLKTVGERWSYLERFKFGVNSQPFYVLLDNEGRMLADSRGYNESVDAFLEWLQGGLENYKSIVRE